MSMSQIEMAGDLFEVMEMNGYGVDESPWSLVDELACLGMSLVEESAAPSGYRASEMHQAAATRLLAVMLEDFAWDGWDQEDDADEMPDRTFLISLEQAKLVVVAGDGTEASMEYWISANAGASAGSPPSTSNG